MVLADGCFDPLHLGHIRYLRAAAAQTLVTYPPSTPSGCANSPRGVARTRSYTSFPARSGIASAVSRGTATSTVVPAASESIALA